MKRKDLFEVWGVLESLRSIKTNVRTAFTIAKNRNILQPEIDAVRESIKLDDDMKEFEKKRIELCELYAEKGPEKKAISVNGKYVFSSENRNNLEEKLDELRKELPEADKKLKENEISLNSLLEDDIDINLIPFNLEMLPDNLISVYQLEILDKYGLILSNTSNIK